MHRQYLHVGERTIGYYDSAPGDRVAQVLVLVHAFPLSSAMWEPQFKNLPHGWRLLAPDMRGFGGSSLDGEPDSRAIDDYARDVIALMRELGVGSAVLGGCSMGGYVIFAVLRAAPELARAVILVDTRAGADTSESRANRRTMLAVLEREGASGVARDMLPKLLGKTTRTESPHIESNLRRVIKQQSAAAIREAVLRIMERPDASTTLQALKIPALVVVGEEDAITPPAEAERLAALIPNAELVLIPRAGHLSSLEQPSAFNAAMTSFLSRL